MTLKCAEKFSRFESQCIVEGFCVKASKRLNVPMPQRKPTNPTVSPLRMPMSPRPPFRSRLIPLLYRTPIVLCLSPPATRHPVCVASCVCTVTLCQLNLQGTVKVLRICHGHAVFVCDTFLPPFTRLHISHFSEIDACMSLWQHVRQVDVDGVYVSGVVLLECFNVGFLTVKRFYLRP